MTASAEAWRRRARRNAAVIAVALGVLAAALFVAATVRAQDEATPSWHRVDAEGALVIDLYVFWSASCPHCLRAVAYLEGLRAEATWLDIHLLEISGNPEHARAYALLARRLGFEAAYVPAFFFCGTGFTGFDDDATTGVFLVDKLAACRDAVAAALAEGRPAAPAPALAAPLVPPLSLPLVGTLDPTALSLPLLTVTLAALDSFNPCAFFVLLFLLSLMVHARSRPRMLLVGGIFVLFSGLFYFLFMAAWLNLFLVVGQFQTVTLAAGAVAVLIATLNVKDYFLIRQGPTLAIPEGAKPGLFERMRRLVAAPSLPAAVLGAVTLAIAANAYELLCTAGFPMVFTRALTLQDVSPAGRYLYLALYNAVYAAPLLAIVVTFAVTLGARRLTETEGRFLKLLSGLMMLALGLVLILAPGLLDNALTAVALLAGAAAATFLIHTVARRHASGRDPD